MSTQIVTARNLFTALEGELNQEHIERRPVIRSLLVGLVSRQHVVLLGPPGTGKSRLVRDICSRINGTYFEWLLTRMSTPEELFGPISLKALEQDSYRRVTTGKLPEAEIAYLDETFKGSSAILNTLLGALNERVFHNDGQPAAIPLQMAVGASNELPEDREELGALWDRFLLRHVVDYIKDQAGFTRMLTLASKPQAQTQITPMDLAQAQQEAEQVDVSAILPTVVALRSEVQKIGVMVSDRRWHDAMSVVKANAWLNGNAVADENDLDVLQHVLWSEPEQRATVAKTVLMMVSPFDQEAQDILDDAVELYHNAINAPEENQSQAGLEANKGLKQAAKKLDAIREKAEETGKPCRRAEQGLQEVAAWGEEVLKKCLKVG